VHESAKQDRCCPGAVAELAATILTADVVRDLLELMRRQTGDTRVPGARPSRGPNGCMPAWPSHRAEEAPRRHQRRHRAPAGRLVLAVLPP
jgi:hypothetical protein